jgi:hypothetical protein
MRSEPSAYPLKFKFLLSIPIDTGNTIHVIQYLSLRQHRENRDAEGVQWVGGGRALAEVARTAAVCGSDIIVR